MPEACFLCLDSSEFMRNGDQFPNRFFVVQEAATLLTHAKINSNAENTVGFLTLGGNACTVFETLTSDVDRVITTLSKISISGEQCHFSKGLQIACLALSHRTNTRAEQRIVAFIGTPLGETESELENLARKLRKGNVAVDVVNVGVPSNVPLLNSFVEKLTNKNCKSRFLDIPANIPLVDSLMSSSIFMGGDNAPDTGDYNASSAGFAVDPTLDADIALAIRMSIEEGRRQATEASNTAATQDETVAQPPVGTNEETMCLENMTEEEMLTRALLLSLEEHVAGQSAQQAVETASAEDLQFANELEMELGMKGKDDAPQDKGNKENEEEEG